MYLKAFVQVQLFITKVTTIEEFLSSGNGIIKTKYRIYNSGLDK